MDKPYSSHLWSGKDLQTSYEAVRAGFVALALEKNRQASPYVEEARVLKVLAEKARKPSDLVKIDGIESGLLTAAGIGENAQRRLLAEDKQDAIQNLIDSFLEPAGGRFVEELVFRFRLARADALGGSIRNLAGSVGEQKFSRALIATLSIEGKNYRWFHSKSRKWIERSADDSDIELNLKGLNWQSAGPRTLIYNLTVPMVQKNVDLSLFSVAPDEIGIVKNKKSTINNPKKYLALGELKGGIDPAGADEHWKTANSALDRIRKGFAKQRLSPKTFFVGAAIEKSMANEIYRQLQDGILSNAANLTNENQTVSICKWLIHL